MDIFHSKYICSANVHSLLFMFYWVDPPDPFSLLRHGQRICLKTIYVNPLLSKTWLRIRIGNKIKWQRMMMTMISILFNQGCLLRIGSSLFVGWRTKQEKLQVPKNARLRFASSSSKSWGSTSAPSHHLSDLMVNLIVWIFGLMTPNPDSNPGGGLVVHGST